MVTWIGVSLGEIADVGPHSRKAPRIASMLVLDCAFFGLLGLRFDVRETGDSLQSSNAEEVEVRGRL